MISLLSSLFGPRPNDVIEDLRTSCSSEKIQELGFLRQSSEKIQELAFLRQSSEKIQELLDFLKERFLESSAAEVMSGWRLRGSALAACILRDYLYYMVTLCYADAYYFLRLATAQEQEETDAYYFLRLATAQEQEETDPNHDRTPLLPEECLSTPGNHDRTPLLPEECLSSSV